MPCKPFVDDKGNVFGFACSRGRRRQRCATTGCGGEGRFQCDYPLRGKKAGKTCDRWMCERCRVNVGPDKDYCDAHARAAAEAR